MRWFPVCFKMLCYYFQCQIPAQLLILVANDSRCHFQYHQMFIRLLSNFIFLSEGVFPHCGGQESIDLRSLLCLKECKFFHSA